MNTTVEHNRLAFVLQQDARTADFTAGAKRRNLHDGVVNHRASGEGISSGALHEEDWGEEIEGARLSPWLPLWHPVLGEWVQWPNDHFCSRSRGASDRIIGCDATRNTVLVAGMRVPPTLCEDPT